VRPAIRRDRRSPKNASLSEKCNAFVSLNRLVEVKKAFSFLPVQRIPDAQRRREFLG